MISDQQNLQNLGSVARLAKINLGLDMITPDDWSDEDLVSYLAEFSNIVLANPDAFNAQSLSTANYINSADLTRLLEPGWVNSEYQDLRLMKYELTNNVMDAGADLAKLGHGTIKLIGSVGGTAENLGEAAERTAISATWILPAVAAGILILLWKSPERGVAVAGSAASAGAGAARKLLPY